MWQSFLFLLQMEEKTLNSPKKRPMGTSQNLAYTEGWLSIITNVLLFGLKYWAAIVTGSVAILADAWHTLSDSMSSIFVIVGTKVATKPPDRKHPFGHGRAELIASIMIAALLGFVAYEFIKESIAKLLNSEEVVFGTIAIVVTIISVIVKEMLAQYAFWAAKKTGSSTLRADGYHHRTDAASSLLILVGIVLGRYFWWIDGVLGITVAALILYAAYGILKDAISNLLGEAPAPGFSEKLATAAAKVTSHDLNIHHIHLHTYGNHKEVTFHINLPSQMSVKEAHNLSDLIERQIKTDMDIIATIHVEPR
jgi:cation diffusion facilitator family transporter